MANQQQGSTAASAGAPRPSKRTCYGFPVDSLYDTAPLPDFDTAFLPARDLDAFVQALAAPDALASPINGQPRSPLSRTGSFAARGTTLVATAAPAPASASPLYIAAGNDRAPVYETVTPATDGARTTSAWLPSWPAWTGKSKGSSMPSKLSSSPPDTADAIPPTIPSQRWRRAQKQRQRMATASAAAAGRRARGRHTSSALVAGGSGGGRRTRDETREGYLYGLLKWPFLAGVLCWLLGLTLAYLLTRVYIAAYEQLVTWRGRRKRLREQMRSTARYTDWVAAAQDLDTYLGNDLWKEENAFAFYDFRTVRRVAEQLQRIRARAETAEAEAEARAKLQVAGTEVAETEVSASTSSPADELARVVEACVKNNFAGVENRQLYSRTYYGTKNLVQRFVDETAESLRFLLTTQQLSAATKRELFRRLDGNYGRTALCLSGGASFAFYHFGVVKALLDEDLLPDVITGTSGGALVAALVATRTDAELRQLLVPALAEHIRPCSEPFSVWFTRWWRTGARFDAVAWAQQCSWWTRGSLTFREAYARTGRVLNVTCVPADPHSPTILCNYRTAPDCVIWSAVLASAAVPGILNPVVLMAKVSDGKESRLVPYAFGHKWKDGSLRTDIPIQALNLHFNVNFTVVSQVNPHVNLFFFSSRGSVGQPVTHRKGRGWRGGYLGSALEAYFKQDLRKWLTLLRSLELLPRPLGQDWSQLWLQPFGGTVTIWPQSVPTDFMRILTDPDPPRLARMLHEGRQSAFPTLQFLSNRLRIERSVARGRRETRHPAAGADDGRSSSDDEDVQRLRHLGPESTTTGTTGTSDELLESSDEDAATLLR